MSEGKPRGLCEVVPGFVNGSLPTAWQVFLRDRWRFRVIKLAFFGLAIGSLLSTSGLSTGVVVLIFAVVCLQAMDFGLIRFFWRPFFRRAIPVTAIRESEGVLQVEFEGKDSEAWDLSRCSWFDVSDLREFMKNSAFPRMQCLMIVNRETKLRFPHAVFCGFEGESRTEWRRRLEELRVPEGKLEAGGFRGGMVSGGAGV